MEKLTHYPLRAQEDAIKRALIVGGFTLIDDGCALEVETPDWAIQLFKRPAEYEREPIFVEDGTYALRSELLAAQLSGIHTNILPVKAFSAGHVYNGSNSAYSCCTCIQGVWIAEQISTNELFRFGTQLVENVLGIGATTEFKTLDGGTLEIVATLGQASFTFALAGRATPIARALLGITNNSIDVWVFDITVDTIAQAVYGYATADELYSPLVSSLKKHKDNNATFGNTYAAQASNILRSMGFNEFSGLKVYEEDCYKKMNMIQESWDRNNTGIQLVNPLGSYTGLPTVLTPALQEALAANWKAGEKKCRLFQFGHIFLPGIAGGAPTEKISLAFAAYEPKMDKDVWRGIVDEFLTRLGIENHFFIPLPPGQAPAYHPAEGWVIMDQNMKYLESNFGGISPVALANHGIGTQAYMTMLEFTPIEAKAAEEFAFTLPDYQ